VKVQFKRKLRIDLNLYKASTTLLISVHKALARELEYRLRHPLAHGPPADKDNAVGIPPRPPVPDHTGPNRAERRKHLAAEYVNKQKAVDIKVKVQAAVKELTYKPSAKSLSNPAYVKNALGIHVPDNVVLLPVEEPVKRVEPVLKPTPPKKTEAPRVVIPEKVTPAKAVTIEAKPVTSTFGKRVAERRPAENFTYVPPSPSRHTPVDPEALAYAKKGDPAHTLLKPKPYLVFGEVIINDKIHHFRRDQPGEPSEFVQIKSLPKAHPLSVKLDSYLTLKKPFFMFESDWQEEKDLAQVQYDNALKERVKDQIDDHYDLDEIYFGPTVATQIKEARHAGAPIQYKLPK